MIALIDCNNFFVSCERIGHRELENKPVIVLGSGDGCVVAMSNEAKALGIGRGVPYFKIKDLCKRHNVIAIHARHHFYGKISAQVMEVIRQLAADAVEVYSIDEAFMYPDTRLGDMAEYGRYVVQTIKERTGIPVSLGMAPTKTLAKIAARFAKKYPGYRGACIIDTTQKTDKALALTPIGDVWGIGRKLSSRLLERGIDTAAQFAALSREQVERMFSIPVLRTWQELHGEPCIVRDPVSPKRRTITCSRTLPHDTFSFDTLTQALSGFCSTVARNMRRKSLKCSEITVFIRTNAFHINAPQHADACTIRLPEYSDYTPHLVAAATEALRQIYRQGYGYKKIGVTAGHMELATLVQQSLFSDKDAEEKRRRLMNAVDSLNASSAAEENGVRIRLASSTGEARKKAKK